jgi:hypothetical protein
MMSKRPRLWPNSTSWTTRRLLAAAYLGCLAAFLILSTRLVPGVPCTAADSAGSSVLPIFQFLNRIFPACQWEPAILPGILVALLGAAILLYCILLLGTNDADLSEAAGHGRTGLLGQLRSGWHVLWAGSLLLRLAALAWPPATSDDIYRYLFDGLANWNGLSPYTFKPLEVLQPGTWVHEPLIHLQDLVSRINHPDLNTVYLPAGQLLFQVLTLPMLWTGWHAAGFRLGQMVLEILLVRRYGSRRWIFFVLASPLYFLESHAGHQEGFAALALLYLLLPCGQSGRSLHKDSRGTPDRSADSDQNSGSQLVTAADRVHEPAAGKPFLQQPIRLPAGRLIVWLWLAGLKPVGLAACALLGLREAARFAGNGSQMAGREGSLLSFRTMIQSAGMLRPALFAVISLLLLGYSWLLLGPDGAIDNLLMVLDTFANIFQFNSPVYRLLVWPDALVSYPVVQASLLLLWTLLLAVFLFRAFQKKNGTWKGEWIGLWLAAFLFCFRTVHPWYMLWALPFVSREGRNGRKWAVLLQIPLVTYLVKFEELVGGVWKEDYRIYLGQALMACLVGFLFLAAGRFSRKAGGS